MLIKLHRELTKAHSIQLNKCAVTESASRVVCKEESSREAFPCSSALFFTVKCPRVFGVTEVFLSLTPDGEDKVFIPFEYDGDEKYTLRYDLRERGEGLFYYTVVLKRGNSLLYSNTEHNMFSSFEEKEGEGFRLLVYEDSFTTPEWFHGATMYHIFVDRFNKSGKSPLRSDAVNEKNWNAPISQYGEYPGAFVKNDLFYGGDLLGIEQKLPYLKELGVTVLYLSPVFCAQSNHKYDTCDYSHIDPAFGGDKAFASLRKKAGEYGMKLILDGVFNHTGDDSVYFDKYNKYGNGAYLNESSPYRDWYSFENDGKYKSWWGIEILPKLNHENKACLNFFTSPEGIGAKYAGMTGMGGWRLDVADELSDTFLDSFRKSVKAADPEAVIIGEVWENAADKIAYGKRRRYLRGRQLDSVMNYPFRNALLEFLLKGDGDALSHELCELYCSYPPCVAHSLMNIVGTHDTERILTALGDKRYGELSNRELSQHTMSEHELAEGVRLLKIASAIQYTVYGVPSVFYGDEAGTEGGRDPFCRKPFPWDNINGELFEHYKRLGKIRKNGAYRDGDFTVLSSGHGYIAFERKGSDGKRFITLANCSHETMTFPYRGKDLLSGKKFNGCLKEMSVAVIKC